MAKQSNATIASALLAQLETGKDFKSIARSLAAYLVEERRIGDLRAILRDIEKMMLTENSKLYVHVTTAFPLSDEQSKQIVDMFKAQSGAKQVVLDQIIDKGVIGGVKCETADQQLDLTVRRQLQRLTSQTAMTV